MSNELTHNPGQFDEVIHIIDNARSRAMKAVNAELIQMYWSVGAYLSELCSASSFGDKIIDEGACGQNPGQGERKGLCTQGSKRKRHLQCMMQRNPSQRSFAGWDIRRNRRCTHG